MLQFQVHWTLYAMQKHFSFFLSNFSSFKNQMTLKYTLRKFSESVFNCCHNILQMASSRHKINHNLWTQKGLCHGRCNDKIYSKILITKHIENKLCNLHWTRWSWWSHGSRLWWRWRSIFVSSWYRSSSNYGVGESQEWLPAGWGQGGKQESWDSWPLIGPWLSQLWCDWSACRSLVTRTGGSGRQQHNSSWCIILISFYSFVSDLMTFHICIKYISNLMTDRLKDLKGDYRDRKIVTDWGTWEGLEVLANLKMYV